MKSKKIIVDVLSLLLMTYYFYDGLVKVIDFARYSNWLFYAPYLESISKLLKYFIPGIEILLALSFMFVSLRIWSFYVSIILQFVFLGYIIIWGLNSHQLFWTFHAFWTTEHVPWLHKMFFSVAFSWVSFFGIIVTKSIPLSKKSKILRNTSADVN
jgi:hypothetical protein